MMPLQRRPARARRVPRALAAITIIALIVGAIAGYGPPARAASDVRNLHDLTVDLGGARQTQPEPTGVVREFELVAQPTRWEILPGVAVDGLAYNGQIPGPVIRVTEGDTLRVTLRNELDEPTSIHWHGLHVPNAMDGVVGVIQEAVPPGGSFVYEFVVSHAGTFMYHSHAQDAAEQIDAGLYGPLIVDPQPSTAVQATVFDREYLMMLSAWNLPAGSTDTAAGEMPGMEEQAADDSSGDHEGIPGMESGTTGTSDESGNLDMQMNYNYFTINGKSYPAVALWEATEGELIRVRIMNISNLVHPMHLHGMDFKVVAKDGESLPPAQQVVMNNLPVNAGETYDIVILAENEGTWVFHCHELHHVENDGVEPGGLIQPLVVTPAA
jgi:manganese oxidase